MKAIFPKPFEFELILCKNLFKLVFHWRLCRVVAGYFVSSYICVCIYIYIHMCVYVCMYVCIS